MNAPIKLYKYTGGETIKITEALRETEHFWIFDDSRNRWNKRGERREAKVEGYNTPTYFLTPQEAVQFFIDRVEREIHSKESALAKLRHDFATARTHLTLLEKEIKP